MNSLSVQYDSDNRVLCFAARELEKYLRRMITGLETAADGAFRVQLEVRRDLTRYGLPRAEDPELDDQYWIDIGETGGRIAGSNARSVLLGVYRLLEEAGCRFLRPGEEYEKIPSVEPAAIWRTLGGAASLRHRGSCIEGANSVENVMEFVDWLPKIGCNSFFLQFKIPFAFLNQWYTHKFNDTLPPEPFDEAAAERMARQIDGEVERRGLLYHRVGHGWTSEAVGCAGGGWMEHQGELPEERRRMLALVNGRREFYGGVPLNTNLCYSQETVREALARSVARYAKENPGIDYIHVWLADECNNVCECRECQETTAADLYIMLLNRIDELLTQMGLTARVAFLLYHELLWAPVKERLNHPERFLMMFAPISRTFEKSYRDAGTPPPVPEYRRNQICPPQSLEENLAFLKGWQEIFKGDSFIYDYHLGRAHYGDLGYVGIARTLYRDITHIKDMGFNGFIVCQELRCFLPNGLPDYVMARAAFDVSRPFDEIVREYFSAAYGDEWQEAYDYLNKLSALCSPDYYNGKGPRVNADLAARYARAANLAREFSPPDYPALEIHNRFYRHLQYHKTYVTNMAAALEAMARGDREAAENFWEKFTDLIQTNEMQYQKALDVYRVTEVGTKYTGF